MSEVKQFKLPDVGEGLTEADIVKWLVQPGDTVTVNQIIVEIETAKALVELPSPYAGVVEKLLVPEGATADVGTPIIAVAVGVPAAGAGGAAGHAGAGAARTAPEGAGEVAGGRHAAATRPLDLVPPPGGEDIADMVPRLPAGGAAEPGPLGGPAPKPARQAVLVGYGVKLGATTRRARKPGAGAGAPRAAGAEAPAQPPSRLAPAPAGSTPPAQGASPPRDSAAPRAAALAAVPPAPEGAAQAGAAAVAAPDGSTGGRPALLAKPPVRKLARDLGVDLAELAGTGPLGSITRDDVQAAAAGPESGADQGQAPAAPHGSPGRVATLASLPREERIPIRGVRKHTAAAMAASAFSAPHVTEFLQIDATETMQATARIRSLPDFEGVRVSPLLLVAKALLLAVARHPMINSSWDDAAQEIVVKHYVNLGVAAATDRGLVVPNIKDAHALSLPDLARALACLAETARAGKATLADLAGGTITITNVGVFGVDTGTPILSPGEAAILAFGQVKDAPWVHHGQLAVRKVCTLALSFDHRIVDGDIGSAVLRDVGAMLADPIRMLAWA
jgi:pyruvate dehydrogenase E2 component (dihydrolipoamide acetyltransferase)